MPAPLGTPRLRPLWAALCVLAGGCAVADPDPQWADRGYAIAEASAFAAAPAPTLSVGFDPAGAADAFAVGDEVVFGLQLDDHGTARQWTLAITVLDPSLPDVLGPEVDWDGEKVRFYLRHDALLAEARVFDRDGKQVGTDQLELVRSELAGGLVRACCEATAAGDDPVARREASMTACYARQALGGLMRVIRGSPVLDDILWEVLSLPSVLSIVTHLGVHVRQQDHFDKARPGAPFAADVELPTWELPVEVTINGEPALRCIVVAAEPHSPRNLCAGVVALTAVHPFDPEITFSMRLLAARRGR